MNLDEFNEVVFNSINEQICIIDTTNFKIMKANQAFLNTYVAEEDIIGKCCYALTHHRTIPCEPPNDFCPLVETLKTGRSSSAEHIHYGKDGRERYFEVSTHPIRNEEGRIYQVVHIARDITERKKLEGELKKAVKDWNNIFNAISDLVLILDKDFTITKANFAFAESFNLKPEDIIGKKCYEVLHKSKKPRPNCPFKMSKKDKLPHSQEVDDPNIGIPLLVSSSPIFDEKKEVIGTVHIARDISKIKSLERERD